MNNKLLEEIGLAQSEIKVYLALLKLGASSTGPLIKESKTANSKIYDVLEKLVEKGLASHFMKGGVKYFKAASPSMILEYLKEKKKKIEDQEESVSKLIPDLLKLGQRHEQGKESVVFSGARGVKTAFRSLIDELHNGEEVHIMGVHTFSKKFHNLALFFQKLRSHKGIKAKFLINSDAKEIAKEFNKFPPVEIRFMPEEMFTPAIFLIYHDKVIINLADELTFFVLKSKSANLAFESYFQMLWKSASKKS
jgi:HTH-type transcriptional regulator, sugar sensing transcriptional regulator